MEYIFLLEAILLLEKSWRQRCHQQQSELFPTHMSFKDVLLEKKDVNMEVEENLPMSLRLEKYSVYNFPRCVTEHFESYDDDVCTSGIPTDDSIVFEVKQNGAKWLRRLC